MNKLDLSLVPVDFQPVGHVYSIDGQTVPSVTQVISVREKSWVTPWHLKRAREYMIKHFRPETKYTLVEIQNMVMEASKAADAESNVAKVIGTDVHDLIKGYLETGVMAPVQGTKAEASIDKFLAWEKQHNIVWLASELRMGSRQHMVAGTIDFIALIDCKLTLGDFKTSARFSDDHYLQTAGYQMMLEEADSQNQYKIAQRMVVRLPKDGSPTETEIVPNKYAFDRDGFLAALKLYRWNLKAAGAWANL
jgi:CRISPR/Cas system-associated exonuclease Cas4 (RecB family)